jgi:hypothetical protein
MDRLVVMSRVGKDGTLWLFVPPSIAPADREVRVTIEPVASAMTQEEWRDFVMSTAGSIDDETFIRHEQGHYEHRGELA